MGVAASGTRRKATETPEMNTQGYRALSMHSRISAGALVLRGKIFHRRDRLQDLGAARIFGGN